MGLIMECVAHSMGWISEEEFMGFTGLPID